MTDAAVSPPETAAPDISVVVPVHNESGAAVPLAREIAAAFNSARVASFEASSTKIIS